MVVGSGVCEAFGHLGQGTIDGHKRSGVGFVVGKPQHATYGVGEVATQLCHNHETSLVGRHRTFVEILLALVFPSQGRGAIRCAICACTRVGGDVERRAFVVVAHSTHHVRKFQGSLGFEIEGHHFTGADVLAVYEVHIFVHAVHEVVEERPSTSIAETLATEVGRRVGCREGEIGIFA